MTDPMADAWAEARRARLAAQQKGEAPLADEDAAKLTGVDAAKEAVLEAGVRPKTGGVLGAMGQAATDVLRVAGSTLSDPLKAGYNTLNNEDTFRNNLALERAKTARAKEEMGLAGNVAQVAGDAALMTAAIPQAAVAGPLRAMGTGAALNMAQQTAQHWEQTGELPAMEDELAAGAMGATGAGVGMLLGAGVNFGLTKLLGRGAKIPDTLTRHIQKSKVVEELSSKKMADAGVILSNGALQRIAQRIERRALRSGITAEATPRSWKALGVLRNRLAKGGDIPLTELNNIRRQIRDWDYRGEGYTGGKIANEEINRAINGLPMSRGAGTVVSGKIEEGVSAWNAMNRSHIEAEKMNAFVDIVRKSEHLQNARGWNFQRALQEETRRFLDNQKRAKIFNDGETALLNDIAKGSGVGNAINKLDARLGHGAVRSSIDYTALAVPNAMVNAAARNKMQMTVDSILYGSPAKASATAPFVGAATVGEMMRPQGKQITPTGGSAMPPPQAISDPQEGGTLSPDGQPVQKLLPQSPRR